VVAAGAYFYFAAGSGGSGSGNASTNANQAWAAGTTNTYNGQVNLNGVMVATNANNVINGNGQVSIFTFGAYGDEVTITNGLFTSGSSAMRTLTAQFTAADVGKNVEAFGIGANGPYIATAATINAFVNSTNVTLSVTASTTITNTRVDYGHDDTPAFNLAVGFSATNGATIIIPAANYFIDGLFTPVPNTTPGCYSQIQLPIYNLETNMMRTVSLVGSIPPAWNVNNIQGDYQPMSTNGVILVSSRIPPNVATNNASRNFTMLGIPTPTISQWGFSALHLNLENLTCRTYNQNQTTPLDLGYVGTVTARNILIDSGTPGSALVAPTNYYVYAFISPRANNWAVQRLDNIIVLGHTCAFLLSEHVDGNNLSAFLCFNGVEFPGSYHSIAISRLGTYECRTPIYASGASNPSNQVVQIGEWNVENGSLTNTLSWANTTYSIYDEGNNLRGWLGFNGVTAGVGFAAGMTNNVGATNVYIFGLYNSRPIQAPGAFIGSVAGLTQTMTFTNGILYKSQ